MLKFNDNALKYAPWSMSKLDVAANCGLRFKWKYIEKKKEPTPLRAEGRIGSAAHKAIELILKGETQERAFRVAAVDNKLTTIEIDELQTFYDITTKFLDKVKRFEDAGKVEKKLIEHQFGLTVDLKQTTFFGNDVFFRGVYDFSLKLVNEDFIVIDHKSGQPNADITKYSSQLKFYSVAGLVLYPSIKGAQSAIHWLRNGELLWGNYTPVAEIADAYVRWFETHINESVANLSDEPRQGWYCNYCGYAARCPLVGGKG